MASLESLLCNSCGAPLRVPTSAKYIKCNHCNTQLSVHRDAGVSFTESIERLNETTEDLKEQVSRLTIQQELADLDREWDRTRESLMVTDQRGRKRVPSSASSTIGGMVVFFVGGMWMLVGFGRFSGPLNGPLTVFPLLGVVFIVSGIFGMIHTSKKAAQYKQGERNYRSARAKLQQESNLLKKGDQGSLHIDP